MKLFKTHTKDRDIYVWYDADRQKCVSGTLPEFELSRALSALGDDFQLICLVGNDQKAIANLTNQIDGLDIDKT